MAFMFVKSGNLAKSCCTFALVLALASNLSAQVAFTTGGFMPYNGGGWGGGWGYGGWGAGSTPGGSYMAGMAQAIRAQGQYNLDTSAAAINLEEADRRNIENNKLWTQTYFEKRRIHQAYMDSQKGPPTTPETWVRLAQENAPPRLPSSALDPITGEITWPALLRGPEYATERQTLDRLFSERAMADGAIGNAGHASIRQAVDQALETLRGHIRDIEPRRYVDARNFLTGLGREADNPAG